MKANELMVGDWVIPLKKKLKGIPGKVVTIDGGTDLCWIDSKDYSCLALCSGVERIPLTPEILEKNGFTNYGESWYLPHNADEAISVGFHMYKTIKGGKK